MNPPQYYFALFGEPHPPEHDSFESGTYHPDPRCAPFPTNMGDILLLYCSGNYPGHVREAPGLGIVLQRDEQVVQYRYLPLAEAIPMHEIQQAFEPDDIAKFNNRRFFNFWLFEISKTSFARAVGKKQILWLDL